MAFDDMATAAPGEPSAAIRQRVIRARAIQQERFAGEPHVHCNAQMSSRLLERHCRLTPECIALLRAAMERYDMSARAYDRILKVARTIADLDESADIRPDHIREAINYRNLDRSSWGQTAPKMPF